MALNIDDPEADRLARELAETTGESLSEAVVEALRERLAAVRRPFEHSVAMAEVSAIQAFVASLPDRDRRSDEEILGYDERGLPV